MSTIQFTNLTDKELVREARSRVGVMSIALQNELLKRFEQYAYNERTVYKKIDAKQLELPL